MLVTSAAVPSHALLFVPIHRAIHNCNSKDWIFMVQKSEHYAEFLDTRCANNPKLRIIHQVTKLLGRKLISRVKHFITKDKIIYNQRISASLAANCIFAGKLYTIYKFLHECNKSWITPGS
jgi:hypothetical protein